MRRVLIAAVFLVSFAPVLAQRPANAPPTAPSGKPPDSVFLEDLTWAEVRDLIKGGWTTVIIGTAGTEQKGPHMVDRVRAGRQLDQSDRTHGQARHDHAARRSLSRIAAECGPQPEVGRIQDHPL